jgi:hypothetical protein
MLRVTSPELVIAHTHAHIGAMRRRIAPAGKRIGERVVAGTNVLDREAAAKAGLAHPILERAPHLLVHSAACGHGARLLAGEPHQVGVDDDGAKAVIAAVPGDHRLSRGGINDRVRLCQVLIECCLHRRPRLFSR